MRSFWRHHGANYNTTSLTSTLPPLKISRFYHSPRDGTPVTLPTYEETQQPPPTYHQTFVHDIENHYKHLDVYDREQALVRDLVKDWNDRRLLAIWKCLERHPRRAVIIVRVIGLDFGEDEIAAMVQRALRSLWKYPRPDRFSTMLGAVQRVGNADAVLGLDDPEHLLNWAQIAVSASE